VEDLAAVVEQGRKARAEVETPGVEFRQVGNKESGALLFAAGKRLQPGFQVIVG